jgi:hypothetical protein
MKIKLCFFAGALFAAVGGVAAGPVELEPKEAAPPPAITADDQWHFNIGFPGWLAFISGDIGLHGFTSNPKIDFGQIITHVAGIASISADVRKGRWGVYGDLLYMSVSEGIYSDGLVKKANLTLDQYIADGEVYYRVWESPRGWLDLRAGARYTNSFTRLELGSADNKINQAAAAFVTAVNEDLRGLLDRLIHGALDPNRPDIPFPPLGEDEKLRILKLIRHARQDPMTAQQRIVSILQTQLNSGHGLTEYWTDPYIGVGGRYNLNKAFYLTGKVDVGGFDVGSIVTVQAYGGLGYQYNRNIYAELGFRYLYYDYDSGGYLYKVSTYGPQVTAGIQF